MSRCICLRRLPTEINIEHRCKCGRSWRDWPTFSFNEHHPRLPAHWAPETQERGATTVATSTKSAGNGQRIAELPRLTPEQVEAVPTPTLSISRIDVRTLLVPIIGTSPLIMHNWSEKARRIMLEAQQGKKAPKENRDPEADYQASFYRISSEEGQAPRYGMPSVSFKQCTVSAARFYGKSVTMVALNQCLFFKGVRSIADRQELSEVFGEPQMREDMVSVGVSGTDLRFRAEFPEWSATLQVRYVASMIDASSVLSLIDAGGMGVGVGDWRPEKRGTFGCFAIDGDQDVQVLG